MASVDYAWSIELGQELTASEAHENGLWEYSLIKQCLNVEIKTVMLKLLALIWISSSIK